MQTYGTTEPAIDLSCGRGEWLAIQIYGPTLHETGYLTNAIRFVTNMSNRGFGGRVKLYVIALT
jgi:hypothetical protein